MDTRTRTIWTVTVAHLYADGSIRKTQTSDIVVTEGREVADVVAVIFGRYAQILDAREAVTI